MVTKGIIKTIDFAGNTCTVRIPFFETANNDEIISTAPISNTPGSYNGYKVGDVVWVAFEDGSMDRPVVIGKLYLGVETEKADPRGTINVVDSKASNSAEIPFDTRLSSNVANNVAKTNVPFASLESISNALSTAEVNIAQNDRDYGNRFKQVISDIEGTNSTLEQTANRMVAQVSGYKQKTDRDGKPIYDKNGQPELELDKNGKPIPENFGWKLQKDSWTVFNKDKDILKADKDGLTVQGKIIAERGHLGKFIIGAQHPCKIIGADASGIYSENYLDNQGNDITTFGQEPGTSSRGIYIGTDGLRLGEHFAVDTSGNVTATSLTIDGIQTDLGITTITPEGISTPVVIANDLWVNSGHINGTLTASQINTAGLQADKIEVVKGTGANAQNVLYANAADPNNVKLGNFIVDPNSISLPVTESDTQYKFGKNNTVMICTGSDGTADIGGSGSVNGWNFTAGKNFGVRTIKTGTNAGESELYASRGKIGGFTVGEKVLKSTNGNVGLSNDTSTGALAFWAGGSTKDTAKFYVTNAGDFRATSGSIGNCTIDKDGKLIIPAGNITDTLTIGQLPSTVAEKGDIPTESQITTITNNTITTTTVTAANLKVKAANIDGELTAKQINAAGLSVSNGNRFVSLNEGGYIFINNNKVSHPTNSKYFLVPLIRFESFDTFQVERHKWLCAVMEFYTPDGAEISTSMETRLVKMDVYTDNDLFG